MKEKGFKKNKAIMLAFSLGYRSNDVGDISSPRGVILKCWINERGYKTFTFRYKKQLFTIPVHRFVAYQKYGEIIFNCECVRHLDGNSLNNAFENIEIGTMKENSLDRPKEVRTSMSVRASSFNRGYRNIQIVDEIKSFYYKTKSYKKTMERFNISSKGTLHFILNKR